MEIQETREIRPRRSALYMPGSNARALEKAKTLDADVVVFDLEDAVAPEVKADARQQVAAAVRGGGYGRREVVVRINASDTEWAEADVAVMAEAGCDALLVPKVSKPEDLAVVEGWLAGAAPSIKLWAMIETPLAILNVAQIAAMAAAPGGRLSCFAVGTNDLVKDTRAEMDAARTPALYWLSAIVTAARAYDIDVLDGVYNNFKDIEGFERECAHGRMMGMDGKTLIHPTQIAGANTVFSPGAEEVAWARRVLAAFEEPENQGKGVIKMDGQMVELLHAEMAKRTVAIADAAGNS
ncbi:MAG: citrate lyase subunit beta/citryl-CoA lyase [Hyphomicrobiaceae bacterium]|jgi:citrate lyase subunit beta/citryl-CoA lyase